MANDKKFRISISTFLKETGFSKLNTGLKNTIRLAQSAGAALRRLGGRALVGLIAGTTVVVWKLVDALKAFAVQELSEVNLVAALKQMGQYTDEYYEKLKNLASQFQETTKVGDETWLKQFAQLTRFGMNADNVDRVADAVKNLAGLMDGNVQGATLAMQRAIEGEFSMFSRYGIKLDLTGNKVKDLNTLFEMLAEKGAGAMEARAGTLQGAWDGLTNAFGDFKEEIGRTFERAANLRGVLGSIETNIKRLQDSAKSGGLKNLIEGAVENAGKLLKQIQGIAAYVQTQGSKAFAELANASKDVVEGLFRMGAAAAVQLLASAVPALGRLLGEAIKNAALGKDDAKASAESRARFESKTRAQKQTDEELGEWNDNAGLFSSANRKRKQRREELEEQYYKQLLPSYMEEERADEARRASESVGKDGGREQFESGLDQLAGIAALGTAQREAKDQEKADRAEELRQVAWGGMDTAREVVIQQRSQHREAIRQANSEGPIPSRESMENLSNEREQSSELASQLKTLSQGLMSANAEDRAAAAQLAQALKQYTDPHVDFAAEVTQILNQQMQRISALQDEVRNRR